MDRVLPQIALLRSELSEHRVSAVVAAGVCAGFVWTAQEAPLPAPGGAAPFLFLAVEQDVRRMRIPNWLTFGGLAVALAAAGLTAGGAGVLAALAGAGLALSLTFVPFALRWLGAGDVKAMMVLGALWGPAPLVPALFWIVLAGGGLAIAVLAARGEFGDLCRRWGRSLWITCATRRITYFGPAPGSAAGGGIPFAAAIGIGAALYQLGGNPWA